MLYRNLVHVTRQATKWDLRFLKQAAEVSSWSKDPSTKVGAVIASADNRTVTIGYNGYPYKLEDCQHNHTRDERLARSIHAELNALFNAQGGLLTSRRMYVYPFLPCGPCAANIAQKDLYEVLVPIQDEDGNDRVVPERWIPSMSEGSKILRDAGIPLVGLTIEQAQDHPATVS